MTCGCGSSSKVKLICFGGNNPRMPNGLFYYLFLWTGVCLMKGVFFLSLLLSLILEIPVLNASSVNPDQTPLYAASDLGLHCFPVSFYGTP